MYDGVKQERILASSVARRRDPRGVNFVAYKHKVKVAAQVLKTCVRVKIDSELFFSVRPDTPLCANKNPALIWPYNRNVDLARLLNARWRSKSGKRMEQGPCVDLQR